MEEQKGLPGFPSDFTCPSTNKVTRPPGTFGGKRIREPKNERLEWLARQIEYDVQPAEPAEVVFRHGLWWEERQRVKRALRSANVPLQRRERFENCGSDCVVEFSPARQRHRTRGNYCGDRFCVPCCGGRAARARKKLVKLCSGTRPTFGTLTLKASGRGLQESLDHLLKSFARLRRHVAWSSRVKAGVYVIEIKRGSGSRQWHPHIHFLTLSDFIPQAELSYAWQVATGDSFIVDLSKVREDDLGITYVGKYLSKGWSKSVGEDHDSLVECILALRGRRLLGSFGSWRGLGLESDDIAPDDWVRIGRLVNIVAAAHVGEVWAVGVLTSLGNGDRADDVDSTPAKSG